MSMEVYESYWPSLILQTDLSYTSINSQEVLTSCFIQVWDTTVVLIHDLTVGERTQDPPVKRMNANPWAEI